MRNSLTIWCQYGLMRPVARIAQSVEQGIENPRVLGSIPSPGTIFRETSLIAGFLLSSVWTLHRTRSIIRSASSAHPCGAVASDVQSRCAGCPSPGTIFRETSLIAGFCFLAFGLFIEHVRLFALQAALTPAGPSPATFNPAARVVRVRAPYSEKPA